MKKLLDTNTNVEWLPADSVVETYLSDELPEIALCTAVYAIVLKNDALLQTDLREGERPTRRLDVPGGHIDDGETPEQSVVRETFEETGVHVKVERLVAYKKITVHSPKQIESVYPYPTGYMLYYVCSLIKETDFEGNQDTYGRVWLAKGEYEKSHWYTVNKLMVDAIINSI